MEHKLPGLQVARGLAALSIAYFHSSGALLNFPKGTAYPIPLLSELGWLAVDFFFAISGFVICVTISRANFTTGSFLIKRAFRLYPLWWLAMGVFAYASHQWTSAGLDWGHLLLSATLLPTKDFPFLDVGWSLQHEMMFYLGTAIIAPFFGVRGVAAALALSTIVSRMFPLPGTYAILATYHAEFLAGVLVFMVQPRLRSAGFVVPVLISIALLYYFAVEVDGGGRRFFPIALFFAILGFSNLTDDSSLPMKAGVVLGDASYSIYLWHPLMFKLAYVYTGRFDLPVWTEEPVRFGTMLVVVVVSIVSYRYFERPINRLAGRLASTERKPTTVPVPESAA